MANNTLYSDIIWATVALLGIGAGVYAIKESINSKSEIGIKFGYKFFNTELSLVPSETVLKKKTDISVPANDSSNESQSVSAAIEEITSDIMANIVPDEESVKGTDSEEQL